MAVYPYPCHRLKHVDYVKYLGVHITSDLRGTNVQTTFAAEPTVLLVSSGEMLIGNPRVKGLAYQSYVRSVLEYSPTVWDP